MPRLTFLLLAAASVLIGCGGSSTRQAAPTAPTATAPGGPTDLEGPGSTDGYRSHGPTVADVRGRTFVSRTVRGEPTLAPGTRITLAFGDATLTASAGCATFTGSYSLAGDGLQLTSRPTSTTIDCPSSLHAQDAWLRRFLTTRSAAQLVGDTLSLGGDRVYVRLDAVR